MKQHEPAACDPVRQQFALYLYGELSFDEEEQIESHLETCEACRAELAKERELHAAFDSVAVEPPASLLNSCRAGLWNALENEVPRPESSPWWKRFSFEWPRPVWLQAATATVLLAAGFLGARLGPLNGLFSTASLADPGSARVRFVEPAANGQIQIVLDETRQRTITGDVDDANIRALLFAAAKDPSDPGLRVETLGVLNASSHASDVRDTLLWALQHDQNAGVRLKALEGLRSFGSDRQVQNALAHVLLTDTNPGIRTQAIDLLTAEYETGYDRQVIGVIQEILPRESNDYVRQRSQRLLEAVNASAEVY